MNSKLTLYIMTAIVFCGLISCIFPYPLFSNSGNILSSQEMNINDNYETENELNVKPVEAEVLNLNWFEVMDAFFTKEVKVRVIDINTKKEYYCIRYGGYNHADVQTIDKANTAIFKSLYNGVWSWERRPVWVEINNKFFAASINGMPHGFDILTDNGEGGHTCIHFLESMTHGTKRVDPAHQAAVKEAYSRRSELTAYLNSKTIKK